MSETRTSRHWESRPGRVDALNTRYPYPGTGKYGIPAIEPCQVIPASLEPWHDPRSRARAAREAGALHFFLDDYRFERVWAHPERALERVQEVGTALTPDFSLWRDMPLAAQLWQVYRSRWCGAYWQAHGVNVIPTGQWSTPASYEFAFDGLPTHSPIAVSSVGVRDETARQLYRAGLLELIARLQPSLILSYGPMPIDVTCPVREYPTFWSVKRGR